MHALVFFSLRVYHFGNMPLIIGFRRSLSHQASLQRGESCAPIRVSLSPVPTFFPKPIKPSLFLHPPVPFSFHPIEEATLFEITMTSLSTPQHGGRSGFHYLTNARDHEHFAKTSRRLHEAASQFSSSSSRSLLGVGLIHSSNNDKTQINKIRYNMLSAIIYTGVNTSHSDNGFRQEIYRHNLLLLKGSRLRRL